MNSEGHPICPEERRRKGRITCMDSIDYKILKILQKNARETASNISKEIHLSVSAVIERIR